MDNPGELLDDMGITCAELFRRFHRTGNYVAEQALWDAAQEYEVVTQRREVHIPEEFGAET